MNDGSSSGSEDAGTPDADASLNTLADVDVPDAFPMSCSGETIRLMPDASYGPCGLTPADVACHANTDCTWTTVYTCGCVDFVYGVNTSNRARCAPPPCPPPIGGAGCDAGGLLTQDCQLVSGTRNVFAACVNQQCLSFATPR